MRRTSGYRLSVVAAAIIGLFIMHGLMAMPQSSPQACGEFPHTHQLHGLAAGDQGIGAVAPGAIATMGVAERPETDGASGAMQCIAILLSVLLLVLISRKARSSRASQCSRANIPAFAGWNRAPPGRGRIELCVWRT